MTDDYGGNSEIAGIDRIPSLLENLQMFELKSRSSISDLVNMRPSTLSHASTFAI